MTTESTTEAIPCPFCGELPYVVEPLLIEGSQRTLPSAVVCENKDCPVNPEVFRDNEPDSDGRTAAIEAWNTRAPLTPSQS